MKQTITLSLIATALLTTQTIAQEDLGEIVVTTATKAPQQLKNITANVDVITAEDIEARGYTTVTEALSSVAGVSFVSNGGLGTSTSVYLRGMGNQRTLILIDGVRYQDPSNTNGASIQHLMVSDIDHIEVIKGAQSGIWGADAAAGVINIITKTAKKGTHASATLEAGSFKTKKYGVTLSHKTDRYDIMLSANKVTTDGFTSQAPYKQEIKNMEDDGYKNLTLNAKLGLNITENSRFEIGHTNIKGTVQYDSTDENDTKAENDFTTRLTNLSYTYRVENHTLKLKHEISTFDREEKNPPSWGVKTFNGKTTNTELTDTFEYDPQGSMVIGVGQQKTDVDYITGSNATNNDSFTNKAIFVANNHHLGESLVLTEALRYDKYSDFDNKTTGKIGFLYTTQEGLGFSGNYGTAYNTPNIIQMLNPWGAPNNALQPETIKSYDLSVDFAGAKLTYFKQKIDNMIGWSGGGYNNLPGTSRINGIEFSYQTEIYTNILFNTNYTALITFEDKDGKQLGSRPKETLNIALDYYGIDKLHLGVDAQYIGERYNGADRQGRQTGKYTVVNMTADYQINKNFQLYGKIENVGDKYYQTVDGYATSPRAFYVGIKAKF